MVKRLKLMGLRRAVIGSAGSIRVSGDGVLSRHAEITAFPSDGETITAIRPLDGPLSVERNGRTGRVTTPWPLADGDVILVGPHKLTYRDLGNALQPFEKTGQQEVVSWLL